MQELTPDRSDWSNNGLPYRSFNPHPNSPILDTPGHSRLEIQICIALRNASNVFLSMLLFNDPLLPYAPPFLDVIVPLPSPAAEHAHEPLYAALFCQTIYHATGKLLEKKGFWRLKYIQLQAVSFLTNPILFAMAAPLMCDPLLKSGAQYTPYAGCAALLALGFHFFFLCHLVADPLFLLREVVAFQQLAYVVVYALMLRPSGMRFLWHVLLVDACSIFLHARWFMLTLPECVPHWCKKLNDLCLLCVLFLVKLTWGAYTVYLARSDYVLAVALVAVLALDGCWTCVLRYSLICEFWEGSSPKPLQIVVTEDTLNSVDVGLDLVFTKTLYADAESVESEFSEME